MPAVTTISKVNAKTGTLTTRRSEIPEKFITKTAHFYYVVVKLLSLSQILSMTGKQQKTKHLNGRSDMK